MSFSQYFPIGFLELVALNFEKYKQLDCFQLPIC